MSAKSKKSLVFIVFISDMSCEGDHIYDKSFPHEHLFISSSQDPFSGDILVYLHTLKFPQFFLRMIVNGCIT